MSTIWIVTMGNIKFYNNFSTKLNINDEIKIRMNHGRKI